MRSSLRRVWEEKGRGQGQPGAEWASWQRPLTYLKRKCVLSHLVLSRLWKGDLKAPWGRKARFSGGNLDRMENFYLDSEMISRNFPTLHFPTSLTWIRKP